MFNSYCIKWKLTVFCKNNKVLIFSGNKKDYKNVFYLGESKIDKVERYKYIGIFFLHKSSIFTKARTMLYTQAQKAMYFILRYIFLLNVN